MTTTQQGLLDFLNTIDPIPQDLINQLNKNPQATISKWMTRSKEDWEKYYQLNGIDIYNHFHNQGKRRDSVIMISNCA